MENAEVQEYVSQELVKAEEMFVAAENLVIHSKEDSEGAADWLKDVKKAMNELEKQRTAITKPINDSLKKINELFKRPKAVLARTEAGIKKAMLAWTQAERARIQKEQEAARKKAEAEQKRKETWAAKAEERGDTERAEELREAAEEIVPDTVAEAVHKPEGIYTQKRWTAEVVDLQAMITAIATGNLSSEAVEPNIQFLNALAKRLQGNVLVPGVKFIETESVAART